MTNPLAEELRSIGQRLSGFGAPGRKSEYVSLLAHVQDTAEEVGRSWSGSNLGYHAWVHYANLHPAPPGTHWSMEWGSLSGPFSGGGSVGDWREFNPDAVLAEIYKLAGEPDLDEIENFASAAQSAFESNRREIKSILETAKAEERDARLDQILTEIDSILIFTMTTAIKVQLPRGQLMSRDTRALGGGLQGAPHQQVLARINVSRSQFRACDELAALAMSAASHLDRRDSRALAKPAPVGVGSRVFIGHGRSAAWRDLQDFLEKRLGLLTEEFNRVSPAGVATSTRLEEMLESSAMAFLVLTAEDEHGDKLVARQNVIHEAGLFQGRLGFKRAIILREQTCEEFSNIHGLGQLPFPASRISAVFEDVRLVLEREGMISKPTQSG